eukprot:1623115-Pleurochrysis_carterae.AAC.2
MAFPHASAAAHPSEPCHQILSHTLARKAAVGARACSSGTARLPSVVPTSPREMRCSNALLSTAFGSS